VGGPKYSDALRAFIRGAVGDDRSPEADTELLARNHPGCAAWLDQLYGPGGWKPLLARLKPMWTTPLTYTAADFAAVVAPTLLLVGDRDELVPVEDAAEMYRQFRSAELAVIPDADRGAFFSAKVTTFGSLILDFLRRTSSSST
jgi:pimeloyl-ACP methyl ester carboxylesterase